MPSSNDDLLRQSGQQFVSKQDKKLIKEGKKMGKMGLDMKYLSSVGALPYQFLPNVDRRILYKNDEGKYIESTVGRKYHEKIVERMPLLFLMPCVPKFRESEETDKALAAQLASAINSSITDITKFFNSDGSSDKYSGRYFETQMSFYGYYQHLQTMLNTIAAFMGILDEKVYFNNKLTAIRDIQWSEENVGNDEFAMYYSGAEAVCFYMDSFDTVSESFDNDTTKPSIASEFDSRSDEAREIRFLFGQNQEEAATVLFAKNAISSITDNINGNFGGEGSGLAGILQGIDIGGLAATLGKYMGSEIFRDLMLNSTHTLYQGGRVIFPEIWSDSSYNRSYNISIKLRSPDHDKVSIFMNLFVPYCKLLCLVLPHASSDVQGESTNSESYMDPNTFFSPYLVKAYSKGTINIDMGIIDSMSVSKGGTTQWSVDGLPTQLDIDISIKDLYNVLAMSGWQGTKTSALAGEFSNISNTWRVVSNTAYMDFLANMSGLNVKDTHKRKMSLFLDLAEDRFKHTGSSLRSYANNYISNLVRDFYENL